MKSFLTFLLIIFGLQAVSASVTYPQIEGWYAALVKPSWTPPDGVFGPVWAVLYLMIAAAGWKVWKIRTRTPVTPALAVYALQMTLNFLWSLLFFGLRRPDLALIEIVFLWIFILLTFLHFWKIQKTAALLLLPYLGWVSFAGYLNLAIWRLNL